MAFFSKLVPLSIIYLYCNVTCVTALYYEKIQQDISSYKKVTKECFHKWKKILVLANELVDQINKSFGLILLISVTQILVFVLTQSFYIVNSISRTSELDAIITILNIFFNLVLLSLIAYISTKLTDSVSLVIKPTFDRVKLFTNSVKQFAWSSTYRCLMFHLPFTRLKM